MVCNAKTTRRGWRFRCGVAWLAQARRVIAPGRSQELPGIASLFNGTVSGHPLAAIGVPDLLIHPRRRVEMHRRLIVGLPFGTCLDAATCLDQTNSSPLWPHAPNIPDDPGKRFFTLPQPCILSPAGLRNCGPGMAAFGWFFLVTRRDRACEVDSVAPGRRREKFTAACCMTFMDAQKLALQSRTLTRPGGRQVPPPRAVALLELAGSVPPLGAGGRSGCHLHQTTAQMGG